MICRMTKEQRDALIDLMKELIIEYDAPFGRQEPALTAEETFHKLFANEDPSHDAFKISGTVEATFDKARFDRSVVIK